MRLPRYFLYCSISGLLLAGCAGDDTSSDETTAPGTTSGPGTTTDDPGTTTDDPGTTTDDPGTTTDEPGTTTDEPGTTTMPDPDSSSGEPPGGVNFEMTLMGYPHNDMTVDLVVVEAGGGAQVLSFSETIADMGAVLSDMNGALTDGASYDIYWYVDVNESGDCNAPPDDHSWEMTGEMAGPMGLTLSHMHDGNWVDVCANF